MNPKEITREFLKIALVKNTQTLRPVPAEDLALDGARIMSARAAQVKKDRTACADALHSRLLESCPAFEAACDMTADWCAGMLSELGGPWCVSSSASLVFHRLSLSVVIT